MSMRFKIMGILSFVLAGYILLSYGVHRLVILPSYSELERAEAAKDVVRCIDALLREIEHLDAITHDWAAWDDTHEFVLDRNERYPASNLLPQTFTDNRINLIYIIDLERNIIWGEIRDVETGNAVHLPAFSETALKTDPKLFRNKDIESTMSGMISTAGMPLILSIRPITTSDHSGAVVGHLMMGRFFNREFIRMLEDQTHIRHRYQGLSDVPQAILQQLLESADDAPATFFERNSDLLSAFSLIRDIHGSPTLVLEAEIPRVTYKKGAHTLKFALFSTGLAGLILLVILMVLMNTIVSRPLYRLTRRVMEIKESGRMMPPIYNSRQDEIGVLCREFNRLIEQLKEIHAGLTETNQKLHHEVRERKRSENKLLENQRKLRALSSEMTLIEARERRQIAAELHDRIGQNLALTRMRLDMLAASASSCDIEGEMREIGALIDAAIQDTRTLTFEISPPILYEIGLAAAVEWLAESMADKYGIRISVIFDEERCTMDDTLRVLLFRAVRELLFNIVKHARAGNVEVRITNRTGPITITVEDDGIGFDASRNGAENHENGGFGLYSIKERLQMLGGAVEIDSRPSEGARVTLTVPRQSP